MRMSEDAPDYRKFQRNLTFVWGLSTLGPPSDFQTAVQTTLFHAVLMLDHVPHTISLGKIREKEKPLICLRQICMVLVRF